MVAESHPHLSNISIFRDRTTKEREHLSDLRSSLVAKISGGEINLTIKYLNGVPQIVSEKKINFEENPVYFIKM